MCLRYDEATNKEGSYSMMKRRWMMIMLVLVLSVFWFVGCSPVNESGDAPTSVDQDVPVKVTAFDALMSEALLSGSVASVQEGCFQVVPDQTADSGQVLIGAAAGTEEKQNGTTITYGGNCIFQIANIDSESGDVQLSEAGAADIKQSTTVAIYGEETADGIHAVKVVVIRFQ